MGHEIVYCSECALRLLGTDFDKGKAFRVEHKNLCADCAKKLLGALPAAPATPKPGSQRTLPHKPSPDPGSSARIRLGDTPRGSSVPPPKKSSAPLVAAAIGAVVVVAVVVAVASSGGGSRPQPPHAVERDPAPAPAPSPRESEARAALEAAVAYARTRPEDFEGQIARLQEAVFKAEGTSVAERARTAVEAAKVRAAQTVAREKQALELRVRPLLERGDATGARALLETERRRYASRDWELAVRNLLAEAESPAPAPAPAAEIWTILDLQDPLSANGARLEKKPDGSVLASGDVPTTDVYHFTARSPLKAVTAVRLEALPDPSLPSGGPGRAFNGNAVLGELRVEAGGRPVAFSGAAAGFEQDGWPSSAAVDGNPLTGWGFHPRPGQAHEAVFHAREPFDGAALSIMLECKTVHHHHVLGRFRISVTSAALPPPPGPRPLETAHAGAPVVLSLDGPQAGWQNWSWGVKLDFKSAAVPPFEGASSIAIEPQQGGGALSFGLQTPIDPPAYLSLAVYRTDETEFHWGIAAYGAGEKEFSAALTFSTLGMPPLRQWRRYVIPVSAFKLPSGKIRAVLVQNFYRSFPAPPVYVDAVQLVHGYVHPEEASPAATAYRALWSRAAVHAAARDVDAAIQLLKEGPAPDDPDVKSEREADLADLQLLRGLHEEVRTILAKWPRGWNVSVDVLDAAGAPRRIDEPVRRADARGLELRSGEILEPGRILAPSLAELFLARPKKHESDARAAALLCAIEGFPDAAQRHVAGPLKAGPPAPDDADARRFYAEADAEYRAYGTRARGLEQFAILLRSHGESPFIRRIRASIQARLDAPKDFVYAPADFRASGLPQLQRHAKGEIAWTMTEEVDKASRKEHFLELDYSGLPGAELRGWALIGGCCQENFAFHLQGTDVEGPDAENPSTLVKCEPGSPAMTAVSPAGVAYLRKTHAAHGGGRKETERFAWVALPPLRRAGPGTRATLRIVADQPGFAVAALLLSAGRKAPPKEDELHELLAARPFAEPDLAEGGVRGTILREIWRGISGDNVAELTGSPRFKEPPDLSHRVGGLDSWNMGDSYGTRFRGWVVPPMSGDYVFWIASDDQSELYLSTDDGPAAKRKIASSGVTGHREWDKGGKSAPIPLVRNRRYYIEVLHKQGGGGEHVAAGWTLPDGSHERPLLGPRLIPWSPAAASRSGAQLDVPAAHPLGSPLPIAVGTGASAATRIEIWNGAVKLGEAKAGTYTWSQPTPGAHLLSARVHERGGRVVVSPPALVVAGELHFLQAVDFNGPGGTIDERTWGAAGGPAGFEAPDLELRPPTDGARAGMIRNSVALRDAGRAVVTALPNGKALVYATLWGPMDNAPFDLALNGKTVLSGHRFFANGDWARLGPWTVDVVDGRVELTAPKGTAHLSGVEVWSPTKPVPRRPAHTEFRGGGGGGVFDEQPEGHPFVVGFRMSKNDKLTSLQVLYGTAEKPFAGQRYGNPRGEETDVLARPGYALGGVRIRGKDRVRALRLVFMRIAGGALDPKDAYESEWYLGSADDTELLGGDGSPVVGVHGRKGDEIDALGLILLKP